MDRLGINGLYLFSPAFNVGDTIVENLAFFEDLNIILERRGAFLKLCVINDNSKDNTSYVLEAYASEHDFVIVQNNEKNLGNAQNIINGYTWALGKAGNDDLIGCLDADGEHNPLAFRKHIDYIMKENFDGVVGSIIYPDAKMGWLDMNMMRFNGGLQAALMGIDDPFYIQSPGFQLHRPKFLREAVLNLFPRYQTYFVENSYGEFPRWGMHAVIDYLVSVLGGKLKSVYLECFGLPPNRDPEKLRDQAWAAMVHMKALDAFIRRVGLGRK